MGLSLNAVTYFAAQEIACFVQGPYRLIIFERSPETTDTKPSHPFSLGTYLMLYCRLHLDLPGIAFALKFPSQIFRAFLIFFVRATRAAYLSKQI